MIVSHNSDRSCDCMKEILRRCKDKNLNCIQDDTCPRDTFAFVNPHQRCGYSDLPFARIYFFYTAGSRNRLEGMEPVCTLTKKQKTISKRHVLLGKCFEDARQDEKHVPDLLDVIIQPLVL